MLVAGITVLATSILLVWLCLPGEDGKIKPFLRRGGVSEMAAAVLTSAIAVGIVLTIAGIVELIGVEGCKVGNSGAMLWQILMLLRASSL